MFDQSTLTRGPAKGSARDPAANRPLERARGRASVTLGTEGRLSRLAQSGCAKAFLPRVHGTVPEIVFLNTAGGVTGGDRLSFAVDLGDGARAQATTQTAERAYRSAGGAADVGVHLTVGEGARLDWLPQETILFDGAALERCTTVHLAEGATVLMAETLVLGRRAMGETVRRLGFTDRRRVLRSGRPVWIEALEIDDRCLARAGPSGLAGASALATVALLGPGAEDALSGARARLTHPGVQACASAWDGRLLVRVLAADPAPLRRLVADLLEYLRGGPLPRVWQR